ncbi:MAG: hypothetical protein Q4F81_05585 [Eubacteriales bacterium]|nr:hypothetical protein [Eubacteriales bacterium]
MAFTISGFGREPADRQKNTPTNETQRRTTAPRKSVVQVSFPGRGGTLAYYNDRFDLKAGDRVYVEGKLEGQLGYVVSVNYSFKIKLSEYKRVIAVVDTHVHGEFYIAGSHFLTFDPSAIPAEQVTTWFRAPAADDEEYASGNDDASFHLDSLQEMHVSDAIAERGHNYYMENRVRYLCLDGTRGYAIVEGTQAYAVEFEYQDGEIRNLLCDCFCSYPCKHEVAAMLQLRETLEVVEKQYSAQYAQTGYFAVICKGTLFSFAIDGNDGGSFTL